VTGAAATGSLIIRYESASCEGQIVTIRGLAVSRDPNKGAGAAADPDGEPLTAVDILNIRVIGNRKSEDG
jgi:hypothetical protein